MDFWFRLYCLDFQELQIWEKTSQPFPNLVLIVLLAEIFVPQNSLYTLSVISYSKNYELFIKL